MVTTLLISFPSKPTRYFQINDSYLDILNNEEHNPIGGQNFHFENDYSRSFTSLKGDMFYQVISQLYNIDISKFYLTINGKLCNKNDNNIYSKISDTSDSIEFDDELNVSVLFKVLGGKGGFGKILKSQAKKKSQSNNLDSCRNLQGQRIRTVRLSDQMNKWKEQESTREKLDKGLYKVPKKTDPLDSDKNETFNNEKYVKTIENEVNKLQHSVLRGFDKKLDKEAQNLKLNEELESKRSNVLDACLDVYDL